jgi:hypothetical protein
LVFLVFVLIFICLSILIIPRIPSKVSF